MMIAGAIPPAVHIKNRPRWRSSSSRNVLSRSTLRLSFRGSGLSGHQARIVTQS